MSYGDPTAEAYGFSEGAVEAKKQEKRVHAATTTKKLEFVSVTIRGNVSRVDLALIRLNYDAYRQRKDIRVEAESTGASEGVDLYALLEYLLWAETVDVQGVTEEALLATRLLVWTVCYYFPVSKKGYMGLLQHLAGEVQSNGSECKVPKW